MSLGAVLTEPYGASCKGLIEVIVQLSLRGILRLTSFRHRFVGRLRIELRVRLNFIRGWRIDLQRSCKPWNSRPLDDDGRERNKEH